MVMTMLEIALFIPLSFASSNFLLFAIAGSRHVRASSSECHNGRLRPAAPTRLFRRTTHGDGFSFDRAPRRWSRGVHLISQTSTRSHGFAAPRMLNLSVTEGSNKLRELGLVCAAYCHCFDNSHHAVSFPTLLVSLHLAGHGELGSCLAARLSSRCLYHPSSPHHRFRRRWIPHGSSRALGAQRQSRHCLRRAVVL